MPYLHIRTLQTISDLELLGTVENTIDGYYVPETLPELTFEELQQLGKLPFTARISQLLLRFFPSFTATEINKIVERHYSHLDSLPALHAFNHYMPLYLAELDKLNTGSIYDYILPLLLDLQVAALHKQNDQREIILLEHNLGNSSFSALVNALEQLDWPQVTLYYNPKRINPQIQKNISQNLHHLKLNAVDNALSMPTVNLFASRLRHIKAQLAQSKQKQDYETQQPVDSNQTTERQLASNYPAATLSTLDSLSAVLIASALQIAFLAGLPLDKKQSLWQENVENTTITTNSESDKDETNNRRNCRSSKTPYRTVNLFLPAKQGYLLLAACYSKIICPVISKIYLAGKWGNLLAELIRNGSFEVKGRHNTFELPVQLERMLFEFCSRDNERSISVLNDFAHKGVLQLPLEARHNINGIVISELYTDKNENKLMLNIYDRFDLLLPPLSVLAFACYLKYYENNQSTDELGLVFVNASIFRYPEQVSRAVYAEKMLQGRKFLEIMQALSLESGQQFPKWFCAEREIKETEIVSMERYDPDLHRAEFEKIRLEGLSEEQKSNLV